MHTNVGSPSKALRKQLLEASKLEAVGGAREGIEELDMEEVVKRAKADETFGEASSCSEAKSDGAVTLMKTLALAVTGDEDVFPDDEDGKGSGREEMNKESAGVLMSGGLQESAGPDEENSGSDLQWVAFGDGGDFADDDDGYG